MEEGKMPGYLNARDFHACGSSYQTQGFVRADSDRIEVEDIGDFEVGQEFSVTGCLPRCESFRLFGPRPRHAANRPVTDQVEIRGWNAEGGTQTVYFLDVAQDSPAFFRWTDDLGRHWQENVPMTCDWQPLSEGLEVRFHDFAWQEGWVVTIVMRSELVASITAIEGNTLILDRKASKETRVTVMHSDTGAIQAAIDAALEQNCNLFLPNGHYRLSDTLVIRNAASFTLRGETASGTLLDIGRGGIGIEAQGGSCINCRDGHEVNLYDLSFVGGMGFAERDQAGHMATRGATGVWGFYFMKSNALCINNTERVYVENCHARHMSAECFYSSSESRTWETAPACYTQSITYNRCSVEDCARNAFNNNDEAENTHLIDCRIVDVGGCSWEGASRFVRMTGCYVRNAGCVAMGNIRSRDDKFERFGSGQHVIEGNTFEACCPYGLAMISASACATQVLIRGNTFVNFNSNAIRVMADTGPRDLTAQNMIITGNSFDMTAEGRTPKERCAIEITASDVTVSDNQIFVNGERDETLTGIRIRDDALNLILHDNLMRNCGKGIETKRCTGRVGEILNEKQFKRSEKCSSLNNAPLLRRRSHHYRGWKIYWEKGGCSTIGDFDAETGVFTLTEARELTPEENFRLYPPQNPRLIHDNLEV